METTLNFVLAALQYSATIYGFSEPYCGDYDLPPVSCSNGATTASGEVFNPEEITAAVPMPRKKYIKPIVVHLKTKGGACVPVRITDKKNERYVNKGGLDLSVGAVRALTKKKPSPSWGGRVYLCNPEELL